MINALTHETSILKCYLLIFYLQNVLILDVFSTLIALHSKIDMKLCPFFYYYVFPSMQRDINH